MRMLEAVINPFKLEEVKDALLKMGVLGMTVTEVLGFGRQKGNKETYPGFVPKLKIQLFITNSMVPRVIEAIRHSATTGSVGDGKIFVSDLNSVVRIRTGETGESAL